MINYVVLDLGGCLTPRSVFGIIKNEFLECVTLSFSFFKDWFLFAGINNHLTYVNPFAGPRLTLRMLGA